MTTGGAPTFFPTAVLPDEGGGVGGTMVAGPDGALWWSGPFDGFRRIVLTGTADPPIQLSEFPRPLTPQSYVAIRDVTLGPDGNIWYSTQVSVGCVTSEGKFHEMPAGDDLLIEHMTLGPDGALWFTQASQDRLGRVAIN